MSYFAKPYFIAYDEWFDDDLVKTKINFRNKERENISNVHDFFYRQSTKKIGASENNIRINQEEKYRNILTNTISEDLTESSSFPTKKKHAFIKSKSKSKFSFSFDYDRFYRFYLIVFLLIFGSMIFFISNHKGKGPSNSSGMLEKSYIKA